MSEETTHRVGETINIGSFQLSPEVRRHTPEEAERIRRKVSEEEAKQGKLVSK